MSYDITIGKYECSYTYNLAPFFKKYIRPEGLYSLNGQSGLKAACMISVALIEMRSFERNASVGLAQAMSRRYTPRNGWGDPLSATIFLSLLMFECQRNPKKIVHVN